MENQLCRLYEIQTDRTIKPSNFGGVIFNDVNLAKDIGKGIMEKWPQPLTLIIIPCDHHGLQTHGKIITI